MSTRSFGSLFMVASCAGAALGCYLVSLRVASERASLEDVETKIVATQSELRMIQTEIGTRGRLSQLERWNAGAFALSAPAANQILGGSFQLAQLIQPEKQVDFQAPVVLASAPAPAPRKLLAQAATDESGRAATAAASAPLLHEASLKTETREVPARTAVALPRPAVLKSADKPVTAAKPAQTRSADMPGLAAAHFHADKGSTAKPVHVADAAHAGQKKSVDKAALAAGRPMTKHIEVAKVDPLAPLPVKHAPKPKETPTGR